MLLRYSCTHLMHIYYRKYQCSMQKMLSQHAIKSTNGIAELINNSKVRRMNDVSNVTYNLSLAEIKQALNKARIYNRVIPR